MIPFNLRIALIVAVIFYFALILVFLKHKALELKYTLLWLLSGFVMGIMVVWPGVLIFFRSILGITDNMNALFLMGIGFVIIILMSLTSIVSKQANKIKNLSQEIGMLEKRVREMECEKENSGKH